MYKTSPSYVYFSHSNPYKPTYSITIINNDSITNINICVQIYLFMLLYHFILSLLKLLFLYIEYKFTNSYTVFFALNGAAFAFVLMTIKYSDSDTNKGNYCAHFP